MNSHLAERDITATRALWRSLFTTNASKPSAEAAGTLRCSQPSAPQDPCYIGSGSKPSALPVSVAVWPSASAVLEGDRPSVSPSHNLDPCLQPSAWLNCTPLAQGPLSTSYTQKLRLPASLDSQQTSIFSLVGPLNLVMVAADEPSERAVIECLIRELNLKFNVGLDTNFSTNRSIEPHCPDDFKETVDFVLVGSSHASRISAALSVAGEKVLCLASPS